MRRGFTLVEMIVALALSMVLCGGAFYALGQGLRTWKRTVQKAERLQIENIVAERIARDIRAANEILSPSGSEEVVLKIEAETVSYRLINRKVRRKKGAAAAYLTSEDEIKRLSFAYPENGAVETALDRFIFRAAARN